MLKNAIHNYVLTTRPFKTSGNFNYCGITESEFAVHVAATKDSDKPTMTIKDLRFSLEMSPYLLGEDSTQMEKILAQLKQSERNHDPKGQT